jgi:hypothetical protein
MKIFTFFILILFTCHLPAQIVTINGDLSEPLYNTLAVKQNSNLGFGNDINVIKIVYYPDAQSGKLYVGVEGKLNTANSDGIGIFLNFTEVQGTASGTSLGGDPGGHFMGSTGNIDFKADFEVDYMLALNTGGGTSSVYIDAVGLKIVRTAQYIGSCNQSGTTALGPSPSGMFTENSIQFAFDNSGTAGKGLEICIPFSELGITQAGELQAFAFVVSSTAYFSDVTVPGNITTGNPGFNPNFTTAAGGSFHSSTAALPVELVSFSAYTSGKNIVLEWQTAGEVNNRGFSVERKTEGDWIEAGFVKGNGTTTEKSFYTYTDAPEISNKTISYRLKQSDNNGSFSYSSVVEVKTGPSEYRLSQNYPNPFNPSTIISYSTAEDDFITLKIYDILGKEVSVLVNEYQSAGEYSFNFNAAGLPGGVYIYKLSGSSFSSSGKMTLLK